jgi:general stress protein 26
MTTITIKNGKKLSRTVFKSFEDLIDSYYASKEMVILHQIDYKDLNFKTQKDIKESKEMGKKNLIDFKG